MTRIFRRAGSWPNVLMIAYAVGAWACGVWLLTRPQIAWNAAGVLLTAHALVCSGYMIHECAHQNVFRRVAANDRLGMLMSWLNGACVADYQRLKIKHLRHHADRLDVVTFDYRSVLRRAPPWVRGSVLALEWAYIPVVELLMRAMVVVAPFHHGAARDRVRAVGLQLVRVAFWIALALVSIKALLLYALAYLIFIQVLRFMDAFQHTYEVFPSHSLSPAPADPRRTRQYEYDNTYSNLLATRWSWLNLLVLNFPYHNAHHTKTGAAWYELPALHRELYGEHDPQVIPCRHLFVNYHRHRVARVLAEDYGSVTRDRQRASGFIGAVGVSFLTAV
ncbi:MAG TPA: fatty acid desaturase [Steroidobacteraceae bacterium]|nr:fatty acid desaturase [Steroidobacteraceae bacterium]